ncbi:uncharacterized protein LOC116711062 isoform X1 [Xiphophorus hellerii]|uniref:uncharacterized protein LOC116711062 isoform X1 n=2 Tax=Xiphophorus hellerii TaxID=8084 RepID=UPI0013B36C97|nr:uncharacterized protein LOC116711062 isoform X1 [Xiphophorus hellerii]XP_032406327.1 uncharacterized protein LOC116711062 isoform X1 [Xiphophorus hellerii]
MSESRSDTLSFDNQEMARVLVTTFKNEKETSKNIFSVSTASNLVEEILANHSGFLLDRLQKFNSDFLEYIDVDINVEIKDLDRFYVFLSTGGPLVEVSREEQIPNQPHANSGEDGQTHTGEDSEPLKSLPMKKAPQIFEEYENTGFLSGKSRKCIVKMCVGDLVQRCGYYPLSGDKLALAKSIITIFPSLSIQVAGEGEGFEHFYDPASHSGFIEIKLRNLRRNLQQHERRYRKRKVTSYPEDAQTSSATETENDNTINEWVTLIKRLRPSSENLSVIKSGMEKTFTQRRAWITRESPTLAEILREYPRFMDMPSLLDSEFGRLTGEKTDLFLRRWETNIMPKLRVVAAMEPGLSTLLRGFENMTEEEACYRTLVVLTHLLPPVSGRQCSVKDTITHLLDFVPTGTRIASLCNDSATSSTNHQPQLICISNLRSSKQYVIVAKNDKVTIPLDDGLTCAVDKLFKLYWVFNLCYPSQLGPVFTFFEYIYDLPFSTQRKTRVIELIAQLKACK